MRTSTTSPAPRTDSPEAFAGLGPGEAYFAFFWGLSSSAIKDAIVVSRAAASFRTTSIEGIRNPHSRRVLSPRRNRRHD